MSADCLGGLQKKLAEIVEEKIDSRLCTQYCLTIFCAEQVRCRSHYKNSFPSTSQLIHASGSQVQESIDAIWAHFREIIVPEIRSRQINQLRQIQQKNGFGQLLTQFVEAAPRSEVHTSALYASAI